jgi:hypothetical protein
MVNKYTISDIATTFDVSERTVQRWVENLVFKEGNKILIPQDVFELLTLRHKNDNITTSSDIDKEDFERVEYFTEDEYQEFHKRLSEYPHLKEQIQYILKDLEYHRKSIESHNRQMEMLLLSIAQKRFIDAGKENFTFPFEENPFKENPFKENPFKENPFKPEH